MILIDYFSLEPMDELQTALERVPHDEFAKMGSLEGRLVCIWKSVYHAAALVLKPAIYITFGLIFLGAQNMLQASHPEAKIKFKCVELGVALIKTGLISPVGQIAQLFKAVMGILYPGFYFKEDELTVYFKQLATFAEELECEQVLIDIFKEGSVNNVEQQFGTSRHYYRALFQKDLAIICAKLQESDLDKDEKISILKMFAPSANDLGRSGIYSCMPGFGRLLEQICACLDVPKEPEKVIPWLVSQFKQEILQTIVMQADASGKYLQFIDQLDDEELDPKTDAAHFGNVLILHLGAKIGLSNEIIDHASQDAIAQFDLFPEDEQEELLDQYNGLFTEEALEKYLMERINSQPDGKPGLKDLRNYMIQKLAEGVTDSEIASSKIEIQEKFHLGDALAEDPVFFVKLNYYLYPDADPSDERSSDLNEKGIRAFAASQTMDPFTYFASS